jgi:hypothetical protein
MASKQNADKPQRKRTQRFNHPFPSVTRGHSTQGHNKEHRAILTCFRDAHIPQALCSLCPLAQRVVKKKNHVGSSCHQYLPIRLMYFHFRTNDSESQHSRRPLIYANMFLARPKGTRFSLPPLRSRQIVPIHHLRATRASSCFPTFKPCSFSCPKGTRFTHPPLRSGQIVPIHHLRAARASSYFFHSFPSIQPHGQSFQPEG